jgi:hypothetical protein
VGPEERRAAEAIAGAGDQGKERASSVRGGSGGWSTLRNLGIRNGWLQSLGSLEIS